MTDGTTNDPRVTHDPRVTIHQALAAARLEVGSVGKDSQADARLGGYRFRGVDAVVNACSGVLGRHGVNVVPEVLDVERVTTQSRQGASMLNVYVRTRFTFYGPAGDSIQATVLGEAADAGDKATAKAQSVALRVALLQALLLPTDDPDPEADGYQRASAAEVAAQETEAQRVLRERRQGQAQSARQDAQAPQDGPSGDPVLPSHLQPLQKALDALSPSQAIWVRENWGDRPPLRRMTVAQAAAMLEWLAANVPPPQTVPANA